MMKKILLLIVSVSLGVASVCAVQAATTQKTDNEDTYELLNLFGDVMEKTKNSYVEEVTDKKLIESAINGMLSSLDPHSSYLDAKSFKYMSEQTKGKFGGLGIEVTMESGLVKVISPIDGNPAQKAGIKSGDYITAIDGQQVMGMTLDEAVSKMRGKLGTKVKLTIRRPSEKPFDVTLKRSEIKIQSVKDEIKGGDVIYVRISSFNEDIDKMVEKAIASAQKKLKNKAKGLVLDLRNNPGGLLDQAIAVSDLFLDQGEIVSTRSRNEEDNIKYSAKAGDILKGLPIVVMINDGSASASEIVAGALQDHKRAIILGEKSFGKGSVQTLIPLAKYGAMRLTTARYYTPSGRSIQAKGIEPDVEVKPAKVEVIENEYERSEAELKNALKNDGIVDDKTAKTVGKDTDLEKDYQLSRAVDLVKALGIYNKQ